MFSVHMFLWHQHGFPVTNWSPLTLGLGDTRRLLKPASPSHRVHTPLLPVVLGLCPSPPCIACPLSVYAARATCPELFWALRVQQRTKQPKTPVLSKHPPLPREEANKYRIMTGSEEGSPKDRGGNEGRCPFPHWGQKQRPGVDRDGIWVLLAPLRSRSARRLAPGPASCHC